MMMMMVKYASVDVLGEYSLLLVMLCAFAMHDHQSQ